MAGFNRNRRGGATKPEIGDAELWWGEEIRWGSLETENRGRQWWDAIR